MMLSSMVSSALLQPLAAVQVANRQHKKTDGQHGENHISHRILLFRVKAPGQRTPRRSSAHGKQKRKQKTKTGVPFTLTSSRRISVSP
jgi:hypothetical protein